jgi:hypothetical protein
MDITEHGGFRGDGYADVGLNVERWGIVIGQVLAK